ncbi:AzlD domain-containing protein [Nocardioides euryhalodurans]|uniref:Branched-chain amino acid transporter n=1 Tax=Nocardioides euryhalodurans TaxID=2518370 RepID=A0A4P7GP39_9ACTN|nr:AzlD domain-containing protein [Nocardioides euryhalodurans]QBR93870.1 hypothetical protein EXE57_17455 [Nocardioides euryhalodurans]
MNVFVAVVLVGLGSLALRLVPLLGAHRMPDRAAEVAEYAGLAVLAALTVRAVVLHRDAAVPGGPAAAALAAVVGLYLAYRGRSVLVVVAAGAATYVVGSYALVLTI